MVGFGFVFVYCLFYVVEFHDVLLLLLVVICLACWAYRGDVVWVCLEGSVWGCSHCMGVIFLAGSGSVVSGLSLFFFLVWAHRTPLVRQLGNTVFISNNRASFHLWWKENLVKHQKVSKYYENDCSSEDLHVMQNVCHPKWLITDQRRNENPVKHWGWSFLEKIFSSFQLRCSNILNVDRVLNASLIVEKICKVQRKTLVRVSFFRTSFYRTPPGDSFWHWQFLYMKHIFWTSHYQFMRSEQLHLVNKK